MFFCVSAVARRDGTVPGTNQPGEITLSACVTCPIARGANKNFLTNVSNIIEKI
jgi:hypothetical protein